MSKENDLNENMTSEEIAAFAASVVKEVAAERKGEEGSDAEIIADVSSDTKTQAESKSGSKSAEVSTRGEEGSGESQSAPEWFTDDVKAEVAAYGIDESDLSDFASREELDRALRILDKKALEAGRKELADNENGVSRNEKGQFSKKESAEQDDQAAPAVNNSSKYEVTLSKELYDDEIVDEFTRLRDHYESRLERLEAYYEQNQVRMEEQQFDSYVDSLGYSDLFGKTGSESPEELQRRDDLFVAVKAQMLGLERLGRPAELNDKLVSRVASMVFSDEINKKRLKQQTQKISRQSQLRLGGSPHKPQPPREDPREEADRLYRELERT